MLTEELTSHICRRALLPLLSDVDCPIDDESVARKSPLPNPRNVQGDVYLTFSKDFENFLFFRFTNPTQFVQDLAHYKPTTSYDVMHDVMRKIAEAKAAGKRAKHWQSQVAFTREGLNILGHNEQIQDVDFDKVSTPSATSDEPFRTQIMHGVFIVAASDQEYLTNGVDEIMKIFGSSIVVSILEGHSRPKQERGHEHFGFMDGISQPALRGLVKPKKGQNQCDAGVIVMGYPGDPLYQDKHTPRPDWTRDGSIMIFRKLKQLVPEFRKYVADAGPKWREWMPAEDVPKIQPPLSDAEGAALFGARLFGRWKSGAPIARAPFRDDPSQTAEDKANDFDYTVPGVFGPTQKLCPFTAHVRRTAPRNLDPFAAKSLLESALIVRGGIPYGDEVQPDEQETTKLDRGLLFVCYQSRIARGFLTQISWAFNDYFPVINFTPTKWGQDSIIGAAEPPPTLVQVRAVGGKIPDGDITLEVENNPPDANVVTVDGFAKPRLQPVVQPQFFVQVRGGDFFFVPSVSTLRLWSRG